MAFQSLYRRYRPQRFDQIVGQEHVVAALRNAAAEDRLGHAYLFSGPRGTGKTSTARILAKVLNCEDPVDGEPDGTCPACKAIEEGSSFDVTELDAASHTGVDNMRDLIASTALASPGRTRLYILDEVHMLSKGASAALLKTLEEPPDHVVFILATTDPDKVLPTIRSRTQHLEFRLLPASELEAHVRWIIGDAGLHVEEEGIAQALREGGGSARDTLSSLDRIVAAGGVARSDESVDDLLEAICESDPSAALAALADATGQGRDPRTVGERVLDELRNAFLASMRVDLSHLSDAQQAAATDRADRLRPAAITRALEVLGTALVDMRQAPDARIPLEVALVRITRPESDTSVDTLLARIERLEQAVREGTGGTLPDAPPPTPAATPSSSPVAEARSRLAETRKADPPATPAPEPAPVVEAAEPTPEPEPEVVPEPEPEPVTEPAPAATTAANGSLPSRDELTLAWGDRVLTDLRPKVKMLYAAGRFVEHTGEGAAFALPNQTHVERCLPLKGDVEAALAAEFGRPVPLVLVVDGGPEAEPSSPVAEAASDRSAATPAATDELDDIGPIEDLEDAGSAATGLDQVTDVFGAVELIEDEEDRS
ncbi:MAG TPA: DNA polymerase III subunit gamma/tau [Acidimicrobiales bacterium]|nr:DNA polymerase III subunit gamma/tau [Acidimicrobiales bacterium]